MKRNHAPEMSNDEFDAWIAATERDEAVAAAADEEGGPRLSLVPLTERNTAWPIDLLAPPPNPAQTDPAQADPGEPDTERAPTALDPADAPDAATPTVTAAAPPDPAPPALTAEPFDGVALPDSRKRLAGWSAERQRVFLTHLAETGSVHLSAAAARLSARSAYALRTRSPAFAAAWDTAEQLAVGRLAALAFDRAINGRVEQMWEHGALILEKRVPSDRVLMWLLARLDPRRFAAPGDHRGGDAHDPQAAARAGFARQLDAIEDVAA